jgi:hypothetical protein
MPVKIEGPEDISNIFSIFHDGNIIAYKHEDDIQRMEIEIEYFTR